MRYWIGPWLMATSAIHTGFAVATFTDVFIDIAARGVYDTVGLDPMVNTAVWFFLFGVVLFILGLLVAKLDRSTGGKLPRSLGWSLLALAMMGIVLMPASGFWLAFPPAIAVLIRKDIAHVAIAGD